MTSTGFLIMAVVATAIFLIQFILWIFLGDIDMDVELDTDLDNIVSFKGLTHFCIGMGWFMYISGRTDVVAYLIGIAIGTVFVLILWLLYKKVWQLQKENKPEQPEALLGRECTIYSYCGDRYVVQIAINGALRERDVRSLSNKHYQTGERTTICKVDSGIMYIQ